MNVAVLPHKSLQSNVTQVFFFCADYVPNFRLLWRKNGATKKKLKSARVKCSFSEKTHNHS